MVFSDEDRILIKIKFAFERVHRKEVDRQISLEKLDKAWCSGLFVTTCV